MPDRPEDASEQEIEERLRRLLGEPSTPETEKELDELEARLQQMLGPMQEENQVSALEDGLSDAAEKARASSEFGDDFERRLAALEQRAHAAKARRDEGKAKEFKVRETTQEEARSLGLGLSIAYMIIGLPLVGAGVGWLLDRQLHANAWAPMFALAGATIGVVFAVMRVNAASK